ncbi:MAG: hypothetical protein ABIB43_03800 [archaeon]
MGRKRFNKIYTGLKEILESHDFKVPVDPSYEYALAFDAVHESSTKLASLVYHISLSRKDNKSDIHVHASKLGIESGDMCWIKDNSLRQKYIDYHIKCISIEAETWPEISEYFHREGIVSFKQHQDMLSLNSN